MAGNRVTPAAERVVNAETASAWGKLAVRARNAKYKRVTTCANCGERFVTVTTRGKFCSIRCRVAAWRYEQRGADPV